MDLQVNNNNVTITSIYKTQNDVNEKSVDVFYILQNMEIEYLPKGLQQYFPKLKIYEVVSSSLKNIRKQDFINMTTLTALRLSHNQIEFVPEDVFTTLWNLESLDLKNNKIKAINDKTFTKLTNLKVIKLNYNNLETITSNLFLNNINLIEINLSYNILKIIGFQCFVHLRYLEELYLNNNLCIDKNYRNKINIIEMQKELIGKCMDPMEEEMIAEFNITQLEYERSYIENQEIINTLSLRKWTISIFLLSGTILGITITIIWKVCKRNVPVEDGSQPNN
ncbi:unnamed protein product [Diamesa serratosioi]